MYNTGIAYLLWVLSGFCALGFHRFYLGKIPTGLLWMCTGGLGMVGAIYDFFTLPFQVQEANLRNALNKGNYRRPLNKQQDWRYASDAQYRVMKDKAREMDHPERIILKIAKENKGVLSVSEVALEANISIEEAKQILDTLVTKGFAELRVRQNGSLAYVIPDIAGKDEPLEDF